MSKLDNNVINNIKMLSLDMIKEAGSGNANLALYSSSLFYTLFMNCLKFNSKNANWINRDRLLLSNEFLPIMYATLHMFGYDISIEELKGFKKLNFKTLGYANPNCPGIEVGNLSSGDVISSSIGISFGEKYLINLIKKENPKCNLIDFKTYCICTYGELMTGLSQESLSFGVSQNINNLIIIAIDDNVGKNAKLYKENLLNQFNEINVIELKGNSEGAFLDALEEAHETKGINIILIKPLSKDKIHNNIPFTDEKINELRLKYKLNEPFEIDKTLYNEINKNINKRMNKELSKWELQYNDCLNNAKVKEIIEFLETKCVKIDFNADNIKINDNYEEELEKSNSKIFNVLANKSPFILSCSNNNFINMDKTNLLDRNICFGTRTLAMGGISNGLASLGFKVFVNAPLIDSNYLRNFIKFSANYNLPVNYIFTNDTFLDTYENSGISALDEINSLRLIPNTINFRPADINEVIGMYNILASYKKCTISVIGNEKTKKLDGTNHKYVMAGAYRAKREKGEANGVIIATGTEVAVALKVADELLPYGIDLRVVTMPSQELFDLQNDRYKCSLLPEELKIFVIEFANNKLWHKYATSEEYIIGLNKYNTSGTKEELLKHYNLDIESIKNKIIELMKNN